MTSSEYSNLHIAASPILLHCPLFTTFDSYQGCCCCSVPASPVCRNIWHSLTLAEACQKQTWRDGPVQAQFQASSHFVFPLSRCPTVCNLSKDLLHCIAAHLRQQVFWVQLAVSTSALLCFPCRCDQLAGRESPLCRCRLVQVWLRVQGNANNNSSFVTTT